MSGIAGIVLAAGEGKRAGGVKALLELGGRTFLERVVTAIREAGCESVIVVGGAGAARVEAEASRLGATFVLNERWQDGQFSSLRVGARTAVALATAGALVALVDHPAVRPETCRTLLDAFRREPTRIVIPVCEDTQTGRTARGHPVIVPADILEDVIEAPANTTLRDLIHGNADLILEVWVQDPGVLRDVDTAADLGRLNQR